MKEQTTPTVVIDAEMVEPIPMPPKKHFWQKKYVIALASAAAAVLVTTYVFSKTASEEEKDELANEEPSDPTFEVELPDVTVES